MKNCSTVQNCIGLDFVNYVPWLNCRAECGRGGVCAEVRGEAAAEACAGRSHRAVRVSGGGQPSATDHLVPADCHHQALTGLPGTIAKLKRLVV